MPRAHELEKKLRNVQSDYGPPFRRSARVNPNPNPDPDLRNGGPPEWGASTVQSSGMGAASSLKTLGIRV